MCDWVKTVRTAKFSPSEALPYTVIVVGAIYCPPTHLINYYVQNAFYYKFGLTNHEKPPVLLACDHKSFIRLIIQLEIAGEYLIIKNSFHSLTFRIFILVLVERYATTCAHA